MKKSTRILAELAAAAAPMSTGEIADAIGEDTGSVSALINYANKCGRVEKVDTRGLQGVWQITDTGREVLAEEALTEGREPGPAPRAAAAKSPRATVRTESRQPTATISDEPRVRLALGEDGYLLLIGAGGTVQHAIAPQLLDRIVQFATRSRP